jgi:superfamily II DNA or RNA helicase
LKFEKREYQENIIHKTIQMDKATLIQLPTGGGKTYIATEIIKKLSSDIFTNFNQILFIAPKIILMEQTLEAFEKELRELYLKKEWLKPKRIHGKDNDTKTRVLVSTIHTASRREKLKPDIIIIDEIHYGFNGKMYNQLIKNNPNSRIIGLSATPYDQNGKKLKGFTYIDDYDIKYLMNNNYLVQKLRQYELVKQDLSKIKIIAGDYEKRQLSKFVCNNTKILEIVEVTKDFINNSKKTIVFAVDIEHAELLTQAYINIGFKARALHSKLKKDDDNEPVEIKDEIKAFENGHTKVLVSVLMLTTGFDVKDTDCAVIARPTKSQNLYKQMVGRILRKADNKNEAILLDCGNIIENLGMPLDPIKEVEDAKYDTTIKCKNCKSKNYKLTNKNNELHWLCLDCGYSKKVDSGSYKCEHCSEIHSYDSNFIIEDNKLKLDCNCGYKTTISEYTNEKLIEIIDKNNQLSEQFLSFEDAKAWVKKLKFTKPKQWKLYCQGLIKDKPKKPDFIPNNPYQVYQNKGWINTTDWIGLEIQQKNLIKNSGYLAFKEARDYVRSLKLDKASLWIKYLSNSLPEYKHKPKYIPTKPYEVYKKEWQGLEDWLGIKDNKYLSFEEARIFIRNLELRNIQEWKAYCDGLTKAKIPNNIPKNPKEIYKHTGWWGLNDWLGLEQAKQKIKQDLTKIRVFEIAEECEVTSSKIIQKAKELRIDLDSPQSEVFIKQAENISNYIMVEK